MDNEFRPDLIWLPEIDPKGRRLHPAIKELVYERQQELARYRSAELADEAQIASLIEEAAFRTSQVAHEKTLANPASYLFRTYTNLVDRAIRRTVRSFGIENHVLSQVAHSDNPEQEIVNHLTREQVFDAMDEKGKALWRRHLLGYTIDELATLEGQTPDYLGKRLRRTTERALRRLFLQARDEASH